MPIGLTALVLVVLYIWAHRATLTHTETSYVRNHKHFKTQWPLYPMMVYVVNVLVVFDVTICC